MGAIKTVLVYADDSASGAELLSQAAAFAATRDAHLVALAVGIEPTPVYSGLPDVPLDCYYAGLKELRRMVQATMTWASERLAAAGVSHEVRGVVVPEGDAGRAVARHARYADISIFLRNDDAGDWHRLVDAALFDSGRPVILCPPGASLEKIGARVAIGWDAGHEAVRAVHDALDLMAGAEDVRIVAVDPRVGANGHGEDPGADLATMLARHGLPVTVDAIPRENRSVADAILRHAAGMDADLIVIGAYGHSRFSEIILGGVTRDLMRNAERPLLMSH